MKYIRLIIYILLLGITLSCKPRYISIPVEKIRTEYIENIKYDSIYHKDSVYILYKGDTVIHNNISYKYLYKYLKDTICIRDTIPIIQEVEIIKEVNRLKDYLIVLMIFGGVSILVLISKLPKIWLILKL